MCGTDTGISDTGTGISGTGTGISGTGTGISGTSTDICRIDLYSARAGELTASRAGELTVALVSAAAVSDSISQATIATPDEANGANTIVETLTT